MNKPIHKFSKRLRQFREAREWSQQEMCDYITLETGVVISRSMLHKLENGERAAKATLALEISRATKIPVQELVFQED